MQRIQTPTEGTTAHAVAPFVENPLTVSVWSSDKSTEHLFNAAVQFSSSVTR